MRYFIVFLLAVGCIIAMSFFITPSETAEHKLIISPYVFEESITDPNEKNKNSVFSFEPLELNKVRLMAPTAGAGMWNLNILFEYEDGIVEVITDDVQISIGSSAKPFYDLDDDLIRSYGDRIFGYNFHINDSGCMSFYPIGACYGYKDFDEKIPPLAEQELTEEGHEYYITVNAYKDASDKWPTVTAKLKILKIEDKYLFYNNPSSYSRFFSIELISYE